MRSWSKGPTSTRRHLIGILAAAAALLIGGCGDGGSDHTGPFVVYKKTGGIAGVNEELRCTEQRCTLSESGRRGGEAKLSPSEAQRLRHEFERAGFDDLESQTGTPCADCFQYEIEYGGHTVRTEQSALSPKLEPVIGELDGLVTEASRGNT